MKRSNLFRHLFFVVFLFLSLSADGQSKISFTNKVSFSKVGNMSGVRLVTLMPAPVTNEYQEINMLMSNCGKFVDVNTANKVLFYDGSFENNTFDIYESFKYRTKTIR